MAWDLEIGTPCWVATGDVEMHRQSVTPRRATPKYFQIPDKIDMPGVIYDDLLEDVREGLEEIFDHPGSRAPFIPGYQDRADAIARAKLLREHGQKSSDIMMVHLRPPSGVISHRELNVYARKVAYNGEGLRVAKKKVYVICEPFTKRNIDRVEPVQFEWGGIRCVTDEIGVSFYLRSVAGHSLTQIAVRGIMIAWIDLQIITSPKRIMNSTFESQDKIYNTGLNFPTTALLTGPSTVALHKAFNLMAKVRSSIILL
jgi:hypothetical protein